MTRNLLSGRISGSGLVSFGDNQIVQFEGDVADCFGIPTDTVLSNPIMAVDSDGNITKWSNQDDPGDTTYGVLTFKDGDEDNGYRIWDTTSAKEIWVLIDNNEFVIREAATPGQALDGTWHDKFKFPLSGDAGQEIDLDLSGQASKYLICKADESGIEWASSQSVLLPSAKVYTDVTNEINAGGSGENMVFTNADWEINDSDMVDIGTYPSGILVPQDGVYLITGYLKWEGGFPTGFRRGLIRYVAGAAEPPVWNAIVLQQDDKMARADSEPIYQTFTLVDDLTSGWFIGLQAYHENTGDAAIDIQSAALSITLMATAPA